MSYIYPGSDTYVSRYVTGHIVDCALSNGKGYRVLCARKFYRDDTSWALREEAVPGTSLCKECKEIRQQRNRKRPAKKVVSEVDLIRWNEMVK